MSCKFTFSAVLTLVIAIPLAASATIVNFDDVVGSQVDITNRYVGLGVTLNAIDNPFPLFGPFPAPATLPAIQAGVTTWTEGFASATSPLQVAVAAAFGASDPGDGGILMSFAFDVGLVSLVGNDLGGIGFGDSESVTLSAYDALGNFLGQTYTTTKIPGFDRVAASISLPNMRYVAYNYTDSDFGFYAIDDLSFERSSEVVPEPGTVSLFGAALLGLLLSRRRPA